MSGKECGDPQSDDVVESTTSRPLQTVGTNWEPDPRKRKLEVGASLEVPSVSGHQGGRTAESSSPPPPPPRSCSASSRGHSTPSQNISATQEAATILRVGAGAYHRWTLTLAKAGAGSGSCTAEAAGGCAVADHVLLRLKQDDVQLGCKQTAEHHRATETYRHAHGGGLHLQWERSRMSLSQGLALALGTLPRWWGPSSGDCKHPALGLGQFVKSQRIFRKVGHSPSISLSAPSSRKTKVLAVGLG